MTKFDPQKRGSVEKDTIYCTVNNNPLGMDIYYPRSRGPWPVLIFVHGGGWSEGDKGGVPFNPSQFGYLVASINYRLYPAARFPAMIEDVKCAIRFLRANASRFNIDAERIGLLGHSAGSHLVALAGLADEGAGWDKGEYADQSSVVQAVIAVSGPSDLTQTFPDWVEDLKQKVFGAQQFVLASPVNHAHPKAPPYLIIHGDADAAVPVEQARLLYDALHKAQAPAELLLIANCGHGLEPVNGVMDPPMQIVIQTTIEFLDHHLLYTGSTIASSLPQPFQRALTRARIVAQLVLTKIQELFTPKK